MTNWFISVNGEQKGPYPTDQLRQLVSDGFVPRDAYVWRDGMAQWQPLSQVRLADDAPATPAPAPREAAYNQQYQQPAQQQYNQQYNQQTQPYAQQNLGPESDTPPGGYFSFRGRISRKTLWLKYIIPFLLLEIILFAPAAAFTSPDQANILITYVSVLVKRCHDRGRTGWFIFITLIPVVGPIWLLIELYFLRGTPGPNRYGLDPLA